MWWILPVVLVIVGCVAPNFVKTSSSSFPIPDFAAAFKQIAIFSGCIIAAIGIVLGHFL